MRHSGGRWKFITAALAFLLASTHSLHALDPDKRLTQYVHSSWRIQDGSAPTGGEGITQTSDGFLWFSAFSQGLYRFDGLRFVPWPLPSNADRVFKVYGDHAGGLWTTANREILQLKGGMVSAHFEVNGFQSYQNMSEAPDGSIWVVRAENGTTEPLCHLTGSAVRCFGKADGIPIAPIDSILADGKGGFWLGGQTALAHWHDGVSDLYPVEALKSNAGQHGILSLAQGPDGSLWVGILAEGPGLGLARLQDGAVKTFVAPGFDGSKVEVHATIFDRDGNLWVGTGSKGIFRIHGNVVEHYGQTDGLSSDSVNALFEDREGNMWAATISGMDSFREPRVTTYSAAEGLGKDAATGVLAGRDGSIWVANDGSLDRILNGTVSSIRVGHGLPGHQVTSLLEDRHGNLWVGVDDGLYLFKDGRFRRLPEPNHQPLGLVVGIAEDIDGNIWAECLGNPRKLVRIRDFQVLEEFPASKVPAGRTLAPDPRGGIWIGTVKGDLVLFRDGTVQSFPLNAKNNPVYRQIIANADGSVLVSAPDGLIGLRQGKVQRMTTKNGLPCDSIVSMIADKEKRWWLYTYCGVVELRDSELQRWWANPDVIVQSRVYDLLDGVRVGRPFFNSAARSPDGRVWFVNGIVVQMVDPSRPSPKSPPAMTYIQAVTVDRKELPATGQLKLSPHPHDLQIDYTSPVLLIPQRARFRYRLDSYDRDWHDAGTRRQAFYTDLPPGSYSFRVMVSNSDGAWSGDAATLNFIVLPAYYQTNWFRAVCVIAFLLVLWMAYHLRVRQVERQFAWSLEARVAERTRIARDLHDTLLQSFQGLLLRFQTVLHMLPEGTAVEARKELESVIDQAAAAITEGRDAVQGLRASALDTGDLASAISSLGQEIAAADGGHESAAFRVTVEGAARKLHALVRDEICAVATEALRNAFRHAQAKQIEVEIRYDPQQFRLRVRDNGKGFDPAVLAGQDRAGHFGLRGMRERARVTGGTLAVWSEVDGGTELELRIPAGAAYIKDAGRSWLARTFARKAGA